MASSRNQQNSSAAGEDPWPRSITSDPNGSGSQIFIRDKMASSRNQQNSSATGEDPWPRNITSGPNGSRHIERRTRLMQLSTELKCKAYTDIKARRVCCANAIRKLSCRHRHKEYARSQSSTHPRPDKSPPRPTHPPCPSAQPGCGLPANLRISHL